MAKQTEPKAVQATAFQLVDDRGNIKAELSLVEDQPSLRFYDNDHLERLVIQLKSSGDAQVALLERGGKGLIGIGIADGRIGIEINDADGKPGLVALVFPNNRRQLDIYGADGKLAASLP